ncbi:MAG TPA: AAA family ATPase [Thermoanaerobacterales bacterium]|nr:AAA family ATPase [Thermoanaerobacterales bacterium]
MRKMDRKKGIPIGIDDFKDMIMSNGYFVDKSLFIKEVIDDISKVKLITRPRRFGKTLNLSMLRYFFEKTEKDNSRLFKDLKIWREGDSYAKEQGQYPVINLTFKDVKYGKFDDCLERLKIEISREYKRHDYILQSNKIKQTDKKAFESIMNREAGYVIISAALEMLIDVLKEFHEKEVIVLIDEYDTPINHGYICGYYDDIIDFMRNFLGSGLKGNPHLKTAVITGIYRVAKESIFSGFNNIEVCSVIHNAFADKFGFTEKEVEDMLKYYNMDVKTDDVKEWYNGYIFGDNTIIYNPWSILNYVKQKKLQPYWVNTSSNDIIRDVLTKTASSVKKKMEILVEGGELKDEVINIDTNFRDIRNRKIISEEVLWSLLLVSGYLKAEDLHHSEYGDTVCSLKIPNKEILKLYRDIISGWFETEEVTPDKIKELLKELVEGDMEKFKEGFQYLVSKTFSYFDVGENSAENFYHAFILGLLVNIEGKYKIKSNRESGYGRPDVMIIPEDHTKKGVVMEFKTVRSGDERALETKADESLEQIKKMNYTAELAGSGIKEALEVAVVFHGKKVWIKYDVKRL